MKKISTYLLLVLALLLGSCSRTSKQEDQVREPEFLRVLAIGNSFSEDAVEQYLWNIAAQDGKQMIIGNLYIGGCTLERHWKNVQDSINGYRYRRIGLDGQRVQTDSMSILRALLSEDWDVVTLQQASGSSGKYETYDPYLTDLIKFVRGNTRKDTKIYFHQTWAYPDGSSHEEFPKYGSSRAQMYGAILDCTSRALKEHDLDGLIPSGTAIENARTTLLGEDLTRDGYHMDTHSGRYTVSLTWYETLFGVSSLGNGFTPPIVAPDRRQACQWAAHEACLSPFRSTDLSMLKSRFEAKTEESQAHEARLFDALTFNDGSKVKGAEDWSGRRRQELLDIFTQKMYGQAPSRPSGMHFRNLSSESGALEGKVIRKEIALYPTEDESWYIPILMYIPASHQGAVPAILALNDLGNHTILDDEGISLPDEEKIDWYGDPYRMHNRGEDREAWPVEEILDRGYALVTLFKDDIDPDWNDGFRNGIHALFLRQGQTRAGSNEWGSLAAWAWGLSRTMDYLEQDKDILGKEVHLFGSQATARAAIWAGAQDERFASLCLHNAGVGGTSLMQRDMGWNLRYITNNHPNYYCQDFFPYTLRPETLEFDTHELLSLLAPRPLLVLSSGDELLDPRGEDMALDEVRKVYSFLGSGNIEKDILDGELDSAYWQKILDFISSGKRP